MIEKIKKNYFLIIGTFLFLYFFFNLLDGERGLISLLKKENVADIKIATLLFKPDAYTKDINIDFIGKSIPNNFVVGYGLDYDEIGRNLPHIYKLKE